MCRVNSDSVLPAEANSGLFLREWVGTWRCRWMGSPAPKAGRKDGGNMKPGCGCGSDPGPGAERSGSCKTVQALLPSVATASMELHPNPTRRWSSHRHSEPQSRRAATGPDDCGLGRHSRVLCGERERGWGGRWGIRSWCILCGLENEKHEWKQIIHEKKASESVLRSPSKNGIYFTCPSEKNALKMFGKTRSSQLDKSSVTFKAGQSAWACWQQHEASYWCKWKHLMHVPAP